MSTAVDSKALVSRPSKKYSFLNSLSSDTLVPCTAVNMANGIEEVLTLRRIEL